MDKLFYTEKELPQRSPEWLKVREGCIGGSDLGDVLSINPKFNDPYKFWERKTKRKKQKEMNEAMARGAKLEPQAMKAVKLALKEEYGVKRPNPKPLFALHPQHPYVGISFDGVDVKNNYIVELKCPMGAWNFRKVFEDGIQDYYYPQVQMQLHVANAIWGITKAYFCSYFPDGAYILSPAEYMEYFKTLAIIDIDYDEAYCNAMLVVIKKFYDCVQYDEWDAEGYSQLLEEFREKCNNY